MKKILSIALLALLLLGFTFPLKRHEASIMATKLKNYWLNNIPQAVFPERIRTKLNHGLVGKRRKQAIDMCFNDGIHPALCATLRALSKRVLEVNPKDPNDWLKTRAGNVLRKIASGRKYKEADFKAYARFALEGNTKACEAAIHRLADDTAQYTIHHLQQAGIL